MTQPQWTRTANQETDHDASLAHERLIVRRLRELSEWRAHEEKTAEEWIAEARHSINQERDSRLSSVTEKYDSDRETLEITYRQSIDKLEQHYGKLLRATQTQDEKLRGEINSTAEYQEGKTKKEWKNELWLVESDFEAYEPLPHKTFLKCKKLVVEQHNRLTEVRHSADELLAQFKQAAILDPKEMKQIVFKETSKDKKKQSSESGSGDTDSATDNQNEDSENLPTMFDVDSHDHAMSVEDFADVKENLTHALETTGVNLGRLRALWIARLFRGPTMGILWFLLVLGVVAAALYWQNWQLNAMVGGAGFAGAIIVSLAYFGLYRMSRTQVQAIYVPLIGDIEEAQSLCQQVIDTALFRRMSEVQKNLDKRQSEVDAAKSKYGPRISAIRDGRKEAMRTHNETYPRQLAEMRQERQDEREKQESDYRTGMTRVEEWRDTEEEDAEHIHRKETARINSEFQERWGNLTTTWKTGMEWIDQAIQNVHAMDHRLFPEWSDESWEAWDPTTVFSPVVRFGSIGVDRLQLPGGIPTDERLRDSCPTQFCLPSWMVFPAPCSVLIESDGEGRDSAIRSLQNIMMRLLVSIPPGKVRFTVLDPVGLGQNFAAFMHLGDHADNLISERIWTEPRHIDQKLLDLTEHMESVIQKYLRNEYETIAEYNERAGEIAEPYRFLVMADCPVNLSDNAARRLSSIVNTGTRCGVYTLLMHDKRQKLPQGLQMEDLRSKSIHLTCSVKGFDWHDPEFGAFPLTMDAPPGDEMTTSILNRVGLAAKDASRVRVPFDSICPTPANIWTRSCSDELIVELGRSGATKLQALALGRGTNQHVLIAGKTGSGKSTLLHVIVTNIALWYSPDEVEIYLVDFKKGVEFKTYATHLIPHIRAVAIESEREFGVSVLHRIDAEMKRRGDLYRRVGAQDVAGYREACPDDRMPRTLLIIDEFQEFFTEDDKLAQEASLLLDRIVRQGRAFGIHVILGSQTLGGAYGLARSTIGQMAVRVALQCSEADSFLIMSDDNSAPRLLARPGEAIYNDASGIIGANSPFQVSWLGDDTRDDSLRYVADIAAEDVRSGIEPTIVFEGNVPAEIEKNVALQVLVEQPPAAKQKASPPKAWFGEPIAIKENTFAEYRRQNGANVLIVGQNDEAALSLIASSLCGVVSHYSIHPQPEADHAQFVVLDGTPVDAPNASYLKSLVDQLPHEIVFGAWSETEAVIRKIGIELEQRKNDNIADGERIFLWLNGLQRFRMLKKSGDEFSFSYSSSGDDDESDDPTETAVDQIFDTIIKDGPAFGIHTTLWCDTAGTLERMLDRNVLREFEMRILFQMGATDSSNLIDSTMASQLGLKRGLLFCEELGQAEKFRPYALPNATWIESFSQQLREQR